MPDPAHVIDDYAISLEVNGQKKSLRVSAQTSLLDLLRDQFFLTGSHRGCDTAQCGACTLLIDGQASKACNLLAVQVNNSRITTIEGLAQSAQQLHPMQIAFSKHHGLQCGFCTPGMIMRAIAMADEGVPANDAAVRQALGGNLCRCTGYYGIVNAIVDGLQQMAATPSQSEDKT